MSVPAPPPSFLRSAAQRTGTVLLAPLRRLLGTASSIASSSSTASSSTAVEAASGTAPAAASAAPPAPSSSALSLSSMRLPAPVSFLVSPYLFATLALAVLLHRIRHLVPPRHAFTAHARTIRPHLRRAMDRALRPGVQVGLRIPAVLLLLRATLVLGLAILHVYGHDLVGVLLAPRSPLAAALRLLTWTTVWAGRGPLGALLAVRESADVTAALAHDSLLWAAYLASAAGLVTETFARALVDDPGLSQPLNLLSFSFMLHLHSSVAYAESDPAAAPEVLGRASVQLYLYLLTIVAELATLQLSYCLHYLLQTPPTPSAPGDTAAAAVPRRLASPRKYRLPITATFSLVQQGLALRSCAVLWGVVDASAPQRRVEAEQFGTVWLNKIPELCFEVIVVTSIAVKALAAALRGEELTFDNLVGHPVMSPTSEEDYPVALIKYVTHLLSTTRLSGLALELHPLEVLPLSVSLQLESLGLVDPPPCGDPHCALHGPAVRAQLAARRERRRDQQAAVASGSARGPLSASGLRQRRTTPGRVTLARTGGDLVFDDLTATRTVPGLDREIRRVRIAAYADEHDLSEEEDDDEDDEQEDAEDMDGGELARHRRQQSRRYRRAATGGRSTAALAHLEGERKSALWRLLRLVARVALYVVWRGATTVRAGLRFLAAKAGWRRDEWALGQRWGPRRRERHRGVAAAAAADAGGEGEHQEEEEEEEDGISRSYESGQEVDRAEDFPPYTDSEEDLEEEEEEEEEEDEWETDEDDADWVPNRRADADEDDGGNGNHDYKDYDNDDDDDGDDDDDEEEDGYSTSCEYDTDGQLVPRPPPRRRGLRSQAPRHGVVHHRSRARAAVDPPDEEDEDSPFALWRDEPQEEGEALAPYLLAHQLARPVRAPLTRRRYRTLLPGSASPTAQCSNSTTFPNPGPSPAYDSAEALSTAIAARRADVLNTLPGCAPSMRELEDRREKWREERARFCVVCTVEERCIVLWPCRCLCLCEDCRAALADRTTTTTTGGDPGAAGGGADAGGPAAGASGTLCPTCRTEVQGFSRIWIP